MTKLEMLQDRLLVRPDPDVVKDKTDGGVYLPSPEVEQPLRGTVLESGPGIVHEAGFIPNIIQPGDRILFGRYGYDVVKVDGEKLYIVKEQDVKARIHETMDDEQEAQSELTAVGA